MKTFNVSFDMLEIKRELFCINLLKTIENTDLFINIDECTINRDTCPMYSWNQINKLVKLKGNIFNKPKFIIAGISSDGWSFSNLLKTTIASLKFFVYFIDIDQFINSKLRIQNKRLIVIKYNASSHTVKQ